MGHLPLGKEH
nr:unnamed protein product [Callosobruchus chinensis]